MSPYSCAPYVFHMEQSASIPHSRGDLRFDCMLSTYKYIIRCTPTFCKAGFITNQSSLKMCPIKKKNNSIEGPPFVFKCASPRSNQCKFSQCHAMGATLRYGMTLPDFWVVGGHEVPTKNAHRHCQKL